MKSISDAWHLHQDKLHAAGLDARARAEIERAFFAGAENIVDGLQDLNAAGLTLPFYVSRQLSLWASDISAHHHHVHQGHEP